MATSSFNLKEKAKEAFIDDHFELAVELYTQAIAISPSNPELFADRAQTNLKLRNFTQAVVDANRAIELDASMHKAYLRKGNACFELEEYQTAKAALEKGASLAPGDTRFTNLIRKCEEHIAGAWRTSMCFFSPSDQLASSYPPYQKKESGEILNQLPEKLPTCAVTADSNQALSEVPKPETPVSTVKPKYRHEFYQKPEEVVVTIFAKGIPASNVSVDFGEQILSVTVDVPGEDAYHFQPRLFGKIKPEKCRYEVLQTKIEIRLVKAEVVNWTSLEFSKSAVPQRLNVVSVNAAQRPTYPSSKPKRVDWDMLEAQVKKEEKEEELDGDAALNKLFQDIYKDADEDTRRAMSKSFVESNGTVLSTDWKEVGSKKVEGSPPDGMEVKRWEY